MKRSSTRSVPSSLRLGAAFFFAAATIGAAACSPVVISGGNTKDGTGGSGGATGSTSSGWTDVGGSTGVGEAGSPATNALAVLATPPPQPKTPPPPDSSSSSGAGGGTVAPDTIFIKIANYNELCPADFDYTCTPGTRWQVSIGIPPSLQLPGVIQLSNPDLISTISETGQNAGSNDCWGGGGSFLDGTIEIKSIDPEAGVTVKLAGTHVDDPSNGAGTADGDYLAGWCFH